MSGLRETRQPFAYCKIIQRSNGRLYFLQSWRAFDSAQQLQRHRRTSRGQWFYVNPQTNEREI